MMSSIVGSSAAWGLTLAVAVAMLAPGGRAWAQHSFVRVDLWLAHASDGRLETCTDTSRTTPWTLARQGLRMDWMKKDERTETIQLSQLGPGGNSLGWTQRCFQLRDPSGRVLGQGGIVPRESARQVLPSTPVLVLENRSAHTPTMTLGCGFPSLMGQDTARCLRP